MAQGLLYRLVGLDLWVMPPDQAVNGSFIYKEGSMRKLAMQLMVIGITVLSMAMPVLAGGGGGPW